MKTSHCFALLALIGGGAALGGTAEAGCGMPGAAPESQPASQAFAPRFIKAVDFDDAFSPFLWDAPIVGFWKIKFTAEGNQAGPPDGAVIDDGYATWHSDGTEIMNSSRAPATGNFCMGAWKRAPRNVYVLNHFALSWDPSGTSFIGPTNIRERVTVSRDQNHYTGTFTITQYGTDGVVVLAKVTGKVTATRITAD